VYNGDKLTYFTVSKTDSKIYGVTREHHPPQLYARITPTESAPAYGVFSYEMHSLDIGFRKAGLWLELCRKA